MQNFDFKKLLPHALIGLLFIAFTLIFFYPVIEGKDLKQQDMQNTKGMMQELKKYKEETGKVGLWTNSMFSGMPAYQIYGTQDSNIFGFFFKVYLLNLPYFTMGILFVFLISFYILLLSLKVDKWLAVAGAIAFAFASYNIIIIEVGHVTKAYAVGLIPLILAGVLKVFDKKYLVGVLFCALGLGLQLYANHFQITYYTVLMLMMVFLIYFVWAIKEKTIKDFFIASALIAVGLVVGVMPNVMKIWTTYEYGKYTLRGPSELTAEASSQKGGGLDKEYAFSWSYGKAETGTILIPNFMGGSGNEDLGKNSETFKVLQEKGVPDAQRIVQNIPLYWGDQPFTAGPTYFGAIVCFLFVLGLFLVKGPVKWALLAATILSMVLSWGRHFEIVNDLFFYYFPLYNKFRTVSMMLVIAGFTMPLLGMLAVKELVNNYSEKYVKDGLIKSLAIVGGLCLLFALLPGMFFDYASNSDEQLAKGGFPDWLIDAIKLDREGFLKSDALRSLIFVLLSGGALWAYTAKKISTGILAFALSALMLFDLVPVGMRYLNKEDFFPKRELVEAYNPTPADVEILKDKDPDFRVYNVTVNPFADASTSYFHKSIGGYHGAKIRKYQELYDATIAKGNMKALNMLNAKYFIVPDNNKQPVAQRNPNALGNAWFVRNVKQVSGADEELKETALIEPATTAVVDKKFAAQLTGIAEIKDSVSADNIKLTVYTPDALTYESNATAPRLAVFSEVYYDKGWNAYIDDKLVDHLRVNYTLRGLNIPAGKHKVEFKFEPVSYNVGNKISMAGSAIVVLLIGFSLFSEFRKKKE